MLKRTFDIWSKRTPGYVFWRQNTLVELEKTRRNYLLTERPVPIADITRRMLRVKSRYIDTKDFYEQGLLRGEYKYFSGKLCDTRHARPEDMIAYVKCGSFFGFWDTAQMDRVMDELLLKLNDLGPAELAHLFTALTPLRKQGGKLYKHVARALVPAVPDLSLEECFQVISACDDSVPSELVYNLLLAIEPDALRGGLSAAQAVELMDTFGTCSLSIQHQFDSLFESLKRTAVEGMGDLTVIDIAVMCTSLKLQDALDAATEGEAVRLFLSRLGDACARATSMMFAAVNCLFSFSQAMEERVVFLATEFTPVELLSVFSVYVANYTSLSVLFKKDAGGVTPVTKESDPHGSCAEELQFVQQRRAALIHVLRELMDQMTILLESATAYFSPAMQLQHLAVFHKAVEDIGGNPLQLAEVMPLTRRCVELLSSRVIASLRSYAYSDLVAFLQLCDVLGNLVMDAAISAAVQELIQREVVASKEEAMGFCAALQQLSGLRATHLRRIESSLLPKLRQCGGCAE